MTSLSLPTNISPDLLHQSHDGNVKVETAQQLKENETPSNTTAPPPLPPVMAMEEDPPALQNDATYATIGGLSTTTLERPAMSKGREVRLEQNRKAARESRRRKKMMIEELQRSVIFFSRANGTLKQQNDELTRLLIQAQSQVSAMETGQCVQPRDKQGLVVAAPVTATATTTPAYGNVAQQAQAQAVATQAMYESQGFPPAAARAAAQTMNAGVVNVQAPVPTVSAPPTAVPIGVPTITPTSGSPSMQTGATMQAMASFQQAAAAAMQAAMGMNPANTAAATPPAGPPGGSYADTINAIAMQQAAGAQFAVMQMQQQPTTYMPWQHQQQAVTTAPVVVEPQPAPAC